MDDSNLKLAIKLVRAATVTKVAAARLMAEGMSMRTAMRYLKRARELAPLEATTAIATIADAPIDEDAINQYAPDDDRPTARIIAAAKDMETIRRAAMQPGGDQRIAIAAAMAESQVLINSARLAKEMRDSSRDDITLHPQFARFREEMIRFMTGTPLEETFIAGMEKAMQQAKRVQV